MGRFVGLHNHSEYSVLDGYSSLASMAQRAVDLGQDATGLTDHGDVGGHLIFEKECKSRGIKPVFGMEGYLVDSIGQARAEKQTPKDFSHIVLLAQNEVGLKNLWKLSSRAYIEGFYYKPLTDWEMLREHSEGIVATSACLMSYMAMAILKDDEQRVNELIGNYLEVFDDRFFLEMHTWQFMNAEGEDELKLNAEMSKVNQTIVEISKRFDIPLTVVNDAHYTVPEDWEHHGLVWKMKTGPDQHGGRTQTTGHMMDDDEVVHWMKKHGVEESVTLEAIENTHRIADSTDVEIKRGKFIPTLSGTVEADTDIFYDEIDKGVQRKIIDRGLNLEDYQERILYETGVIMDRDFHPYFLMVSDYCRWAKSVGMLVGPGRGSGAGSLVAYLLDITEVDPVKYNLPFERFMNPGRYSFPDLDIDFPQSRRGEVVEYLKSRYGVDRVSGIGTYARRGPKLAAKDLCRALGISISESTEIAKVINRITKAISIPDPDLIEGEVEGDEEPEEPFIDIKLVIQDPELAPWVSKYPVLFDMIIDMVGTIRGHGRHASGIIISTEPISDILPLRTLKFGSERIIVSQFENKTSFPDNMEIEEFGLIKFDVLGLRNLDTLTEANRLVNGNLSNGFPDPNFFYEFGNKQYRDPLPWKDINSSALGIFQIETSSGARIAKQFKPFNEYEMSDLISVNRPGLTRSGNLDEYLNRRSGKSEVKLAHPLLADIVKKTYGMFVYQEQIMFAVQKLANYTLSEADNIRKVMGKKHQEQLDALKPEFISRCLSNPEFTEPVKDPEKVAKAIWDDMEYFGSYAFNMAHALAYGFIGAWSLYLKHYHPIEFLTACLATDDKKKHPAYLREVRKKGFKVLPPDINISGANFTIDDEGVRYGLSSVRGVGPAAVKSIIKKRTHTDLDSFFADKVVNATASQNLIKVGAFDSVESDRYEAMYKFLWHQDVPPYREVFLKHGLKSKMKMTDEMLAEADELYATRTRAALPSYEFDNKETILEYEMELIGDYVSEDPMLEFSEVWEEMCITNEELDELGAGAKVFIGGKIDRIKMHQQKNGDPMAFIDFSNDNDEFSLPIFNYKLREIGPLLQVGKPILCGCVIKEYKGKISPVLNEFIRLDLVS